MALRYIICPECKGNGYSDETAQTCKECGGLCEIPVYDDLAPIEEPPDDLP